VLADRRLADRVLAVLQVAFDGHDRVATVQPLVDFALQLAVADAAVSDLAVARLTTLRHASPQNA